MATKIDTTYIVPEEVAALGRRTVHRMQQGEYQAVKYNRMSYRAWRDHLLSVCLGSFEWDGLPEEIDPRFIEYTLLTCGLGGFFSLKDGLAMWGFAPATPLGRPNMYYNPNRVQLQPVNGGLPWFKHAYYWVSGGVMYEPDCALCYDSLSRRSFMPTIEYYARRLAVFDRTVDVNVQVQQTPYLLAVPQEMRKDATRLMNSIMGHSPVLVVNDRMADSAGLSVVNPQAPYLADKLLADQVKVLNLFYNLVGVDNSNTEKRERVSDKEATSNNEQIMIIRKSRLSCREKFCREVARLTDGEYTPTVRYAVPYREDGTVDMAYSGQVSA